MNSFRSHCLTSTLRPIGTLRALVPIKLLLQVVLSVYSSAERGHRNFELLPARCAHGKSGSAAKPFRNLNCPLRHRHTKDSRIGHPKAYLRVGARGRGSSATQGGSVSQPTPYFHQDWRPISISQSHRLLLWLRRDDRQLLLSMLPCHSERQQPSP